MTDFGQRRRVLPKTGQIISYREGDDGYYQKGWRDGDRFKDVGDGTIVDNATGLMWAKDANGPGGNNGLNLPWSLQVLYAYYLDWKGYDDWRMPNIYELHSLIDYGTANLDINLIIDNAFRLTLWISTTHPGMPGVGWVWFFGLQSFYLLPQGQQARILCCRDA